MPAVIDPQFSVQNLVQRVHPINAIMRHRYTMSRVSYEIENATLIDGASTRIFAGFQFLSRFLPQMTRYTRIAARAEAVYVFGVADVELPAIPNIIYIPLATTDQLAREWFLVSYGPDYASALATEEVSVPGTPDGERIFNGVWTFNLSLVSILQDWLTNIVDANPLYWSAEDMRYEKQMQLMMNNLERLMKQPRSVSPAISHAQDAVFLRELESVILAELQASIRDRQITR